MEHVSAEVNKGAKELSLFTNSAAGVFQRSVIDGVGQVTGPAGYRLRIHELVQPRAEAAEAAALAGQSAGALVLANVLGDAELEALDASGRPITLVSHRVDRLRLPTILHDNRQGMRQLVQHLATAGRQQPVFVAGNPGQLDGAERERAFRDELLRLGLRVPPTHFLEGGFEPEVAERSLLAFLDGGGRLDALVSADYLMAVPLLALLRGRGLRVPQDVTVAAYGDGPEAEAAGLTTVAADVVELGRAAARQLLAQIAGPAIRGTTLLSTRLIRRRS